MADEDALCRAVARGDEEGARFLVLGGADANANSDEGTSVIAALILGALRLEEIDASQALASAPGRVSILSFLLYRRAFSLKALNAPDVSLNGLTPLCMAAYLGRLDLVSTLLEKGDGLVLVDGTDTHRATAAMYAARDGHTDVLRYLIRQGARADGVDRHHRSVSFYANLHPQCLWACEVSLRLRRAEALLSHRKKRKLKLALQQNANDYVSHGAMYQQRPVPTLAQSEWTSYVKVLVDAISTSDHLAVHSLLFPHVTSDSAVPALVNLPDERGWSPIHHCVSAQQPNARILDALYLAGADLTLYTSNNAYSPLHILAREGGSGNSTSFRIYAFVVHLVRDLGAPLNAVDAQGNTCLHIAAQHGTCLDILMAFLECDRDGTIRKMRNYEGFTAEEIAKPDFLSAFEPDDGSRRPDSAASMRTIKASFSNSSLMSNHSSTSSDSSKSGEDEICETFPPPISPAKEHLREVVGQIEDIEQLMKALEVVCEQSEKLDIMAQSQQSSLSNLPIDETEERLHLCKQDASIVLENMRSLIDTEFADLEALKKVYDSLRQLVMQLEAEVQEGRLTKTPSAHLDTPRNIQPTLHLRTSFSTLRSGATTPSLVASGSSSSHSSFASFADLHLATPTDSPRFEKRASVFGGSSVESEEAAEYFKGAEQIDFACALAAGSVTRSRRASSALNLSTSASLAPSVPVTNCIHGGASDSPLESGTDLVSIPPQYASAPSVRTGHHDNVQSSPGSELWLGPIVRQANARTFQSHLENLLEIEKVLFGDEDAEREQTPHPDIGMNLGDTVDGTDDCWRASIDVLHEIVEDLEDREEPGNFLEMFEGGTNATPDDVDTDVTVGPSTEEYDQCSSEADVDYASSLSPSDIVYIAHKEALDLAEAIIIVERTLNTAEQYLSRAERHVDRVFKVKEHALQAARLSFALSDLCHLEDGFDLRRASIQRTSSYQSFAPASSPVSYRLRLGRSPLTMSSDRAQRTYKPDAKAKVLSPRSPAFPSSTRTSSPEDLHNASDELRSLRRLLVRKIPVGLGHVADEIDSAAAWLGVVLGVVRIVKRTCL